MLQTSFSRETTFIMGILKKCFVTEKVQDASNSLISGPTADERTDPSTEGVFCHSVPSTEAVFCHSNPSTEAANCHSAPPTEGTSTEGVFSNSVPSTEAVFCHSNPLTEASLNFAGSSQTTDQLDTQIPSISQGSGSNKPSLSISDLPLTQDKVESTYADVFQGLGKFPGEPYKLRLKPDAVPAKHRPRKVPYICKRHSMRRLNDW